MTTNRGRWENGVRMGLAVLSLAGALAACGGDEPATPDADAEADAQEKLTPEERLFLEAGRPFALAIAARDYAKAFSLLSPLAHRRMSANQFAPGSDDAAFAQREKEPRMNVGAEEFARLMGEAEVRYGQPTALASLHVHETDRAILAGTATGKLAAIDRMFAIGNMPADIPGDIRRASLRGQVHTQLSNEDMDAEAKRLGITREALAKDENFQPYFTIKLVLVEDGGALRVAYFELLPPSMLD